jgi:hypothetical protein
MFQFPQTATLWTKSTNDGFGGTSFGSPSSLAVRWEDERVRFIDADGQETVSRALVWFKDADAVLEGDFLYLGTSTSTTPQSLTGAHEVRRVEVTPSLSANEYERIAYL